MPMDDLKLLFTLIYGSLTSLQNPRRFIEGIVLKNGLKISPKKCQLFRTNLNYMGNEIFIKDKQTLCIKPLRSRLEAIQKLQPPTRVKGHRSFDGNGECF